MADRQITYLTDALIITCIVQASHADTVVKAAQNVGAQGATVTYARGTGVRERMGLMGVTIDEQKEMVRISFPRSKPIGYLKRCIWPVSWISRAWASCS